MLSLLELFMMILVQIVTRTEVVHLTLSERFLLLSFLIMGIVKLFKLVFYIKEHLIGGITCVRFDYTATLIIAGPVLIMVKSLYTDNIISNMLLMICEGQVDCADSVLVALSGP